MKKRLRKKLDRGEFEPIMYVVELDRAPTFEDLEALADPINAEGWTEFSRGNLLSIMACPHKGCLGYRPGPGHPFNVEDHARLRRMLTGVGFKIMRSRVDRRSRWDRPWPEHVSGYVRYAHDPAPGTL